MKSRNEAMVASAKPGPAVDAVGRPAVDPTENVLQLVQAAVRRLDDLAERDREHHKEIAEAHHSHIKEIINRDRAHAQELRALETARLDAVRAVDVGAVQTAATAAENRAAALGAQVAAAADAVRATTEATRLANTELVTSTVKPLADAISVIQQWMNQQTGQRAQVVETRESRGAFGASTGTVIGALGFIVALVALYLRSTGKSP